MALEQKVNDFMAKVIAKNPGEAEFHQAVHEVAETLIPYIEENPIYKTNKILERISEPEIATILSFKLSPLVFSIYSAK